MRIIIREAAADDLDNIFAWIAQYDPNAAAEVIDRLCESIAVLQLDNLVKIGRPGQIPGTRELIQYPYIIIYQIHEIRDEVEVLSIVHGAQNRHSDSVFD